jgi:hypothetical protein
LDLLHSVALLPVEWLRNAPATPDALAGSDGVVIQVEARVAVVAIVTIGAAFHARLSGAAARFTPAFPGLNLARQQRLSNQPLPP